MLLQVALIYSAYLGISCLFSVEPLLRPIYKGMVYLVYVIVYIAGIAWLYSNRIGRAGENRAHNILIAILVVYAPISALVYFQQNTLFESRLLPLLGEHPTIMFSQLMGFALVLSAIKFFEVESISFRLILGGAVAVLLFCMMTSLSRGPILGVAIAGGTLLLAKRQFKTTLILLGLLAVAIGIFVLFNDQDLGRFTDTSDSHRFEIYRSLWEKISDQHRHWIGMGLSAETENAAAGWGYAHSLFIGNYYYGGILGSVLLVALVGYAFWVSIRVNRLEGNAHPLVLLAFGIGANLFDGYALVSRPQVLWILVWYPIALAAAADLRLRKAVLKTP